MRRMISPVAALIASFKPVETIPAGLLITRRHGFSFSSRSRMARVPSSDIPSATMTSNPPDGGSWARIDRRESSIRSCSFRAGIITDTLELVVITSPFTRFYQLRYNMEICGCGWDRRNTGNTLIGAHIVTTRCRSCTASKIIDHHRGKIQSSGDGWGSRDQTEVEAGGIREIRRRCPTCYVVCNRVASGISTPASPMLRLFLQTAPTPLSLLMPLPPFLYVVLL